MADGTLMARVTSPDNGSVSAWPDEGESSVDAMMDALTSFEGIHPLAASHKPLLWRVLLFLYPERIRARFCIWQAQRETSKMIGKS